MNAVTTNFFHENSNNASPYLEVFDDLLHKIREEIETKKQLKEASNDLNTLSKLVPLAIASIEKQHNDIESSVDIFLLVDHLSVSFSDDIDSLIENLETIKPSLLLKTLHHRVITSLKLVRDSLLSFLDALKSAFSPREDEMIQLSKKDWEVINQQMESDLTVNDPNIIKALSRYNQRYTH